MTTLEQRIRVAINGEIFDDKTARVSVFDRGFLYGDSVYEVMRTYGGRPFAQAEHLSRLERSAELLCIELPLSRGELAAEIARTLAAAGNPESYIRVIVTRGAGPIGLDPALAVEPSRVIIVGPQRTYPAELYQRGETIRLVRTGRTAGGALPLGAKSGNYLTNILALRQARALGAGEALLLDSRGRVAEGASSNVFAVIRGELCTPPLSVGILEGITRHFVIGLARELGLPLCEQELTRDELLGAEEVFLTSTMREILPVTRVDEVTVGDGRPGPITGRLAEAYRRRARAHAG